MATRDAQFGDTNDDAPDRCGEISPSELIDALQVIQKNVGGGIEPIDFESLSRSEPTIETMLQSLPGAACLCDADGLILAFNRRAAVLWDREPKLRNPEDRYSGAFKLWRTDGSRVEHRDCWMARVLRENRTVSRREMVIERQDRSRRRILEQASPIHNAEGRVIGAVSVFVDISERHPGEFVRNELAAIVESANDAIIGKLINGTVKSWNRAAERLYGYTAEEMVGQSIMKIIPPELREEAEEIHARMFRGERIEQFETRRVRKDGTLVDIALTLSPLLDSRGRVYAGSAIARDITERKRLQRQLEIRVRQQRTAAMLGTRAVQTDDIAGFLQELTRCVADTLEVELCNVLQLEPDGQSLLLRAGVGWRDGLVGHATVAAGDRSQAGFTLISGEPVVVADLATETRFSGSSLLTDHGVVSGMSTLIHGHREVFGILGVHTLRRRVFCEDDIRFLEVVTSIIHGLVVRIESQHELISREQQERQIVERELQQVRERLVRSTRLTMLGSISAQVAHDLRNPLGSIRNAAWFLKGELIDAQDQVREFIDLINDEVTTCDTIIRNLLDATRDREPVRQQVSLAELVQAAAQRSRFPDTVNLRLEIPDDPFTVSFDPVQARQVLDNLLANAREAVEKDGRIEVSLRKEPGSVLLRIRDSGPGVPEENRNLIFDLLFTTKARGTGIGLAICRQIMERHGGGIVLETVAPEAASFLLKFRTDPGTE